MTLPQPKRQSGALDSPEPPLSMTAQSNILPNASAESWQNRSQGECPTGFYRFQGWNRQQRGPEKCRPVRGLAPQGAYLIRSPRVTVTCSTSATGPPL